MEGFTFEGPRLADWRPAAGLIAIAGFTLALAAMYGGVTAMIWPLPLVVLAAELWRRWYESPRARLEVDDAGFRYSGRAGGVIPWERVRAVETRPVGDRDRVVVALADGDEVPIDAAPLGLLSTQLASLLQSSLRASREG